MATPLTSVPYIGESTERDLRRRLKGSRNTSKIGKPVSVNEATLRKNKQIVEFVLDERQQKELRKASATPKRRQRMEERENRTTTESSTTNVGDFRVSKDDRETAWNTHQERTAVSQEQDEEQRARITTDVDRWQSDPNSYDYPGIDTPSRKPRRQEKDKGFVDTDSLIRPFDSDSEDEDDDDMDGMIPGL